MNLLSNSVNNKFLKSDIFKDQKINLFVISILISLIATAINQSWLFDPKGWLDHWAYFAFPIISLISLKDLQKYLQLN